MKTRALGKTQAAFLRAMLDHGGIWHEKCGWYWGSRLGTIRLCEALERRGLLWRKGLDAYWFIEDKTKTQRALKAIEPK